MFVETLIDELYDMIHEGAIDKSGEVKIRFYAAGHEHTADFTASLLNYDDEKNLVIDARYN